MKIKPMRSIKGLFIALICMVSLTAFATTSEPAQKSTPVYDMHCQPAAIVVAANVEMFNLNALDGLCKIQITDMGTFKVEVTAVGGHMVDRTKKNGEVVDFNAEGAFSPDAIAKRFTEELQRFGVNVEVAVIRHWPGQPDEVVDDLLTGVRTTTV